ncbi:uncharacterized protein A1O9_07868 [Exophiala aquamarina CBS 119918]|uniref:Choline kinase N-terminal domain-containing protein n=1 Tax=Exophiala aquamarina CBS 119918 TaxID=1182545 RepID=A0A072P995_9EURO|nr:uncharacterized protein A1O9_07868 [Exophiala aquamarina CBS 119918]KEF56287.1 hypothetical protein A1O9_07868 [Exophiala aquamarina CBS 119918]
MTGRPPLPQANSSASLAQQMSYFSLDNSKPEATDTPAESKTPDLRSLLSQVVDWLQEEKAKQQRRRHATRQHPHSQHHHQHQHQQQQHRRTTREQDPQGTSTPPQQPQHQRAQSTDDTEPAFEKLEDILAGFTASYLQNLPKLTHKSSTSLFRRGSIAKKFTKRGSIVPQSSDTEFFGDDILVPNVEATLDNSKTLSYTGGSADADTSDTAKQRDLKHWVTFKQDVIRLTHTLRLKGWRQIPIDRAADIDVGRLSGALTNAVYVVRPPKNMADYASQASKGSSTSLDTSSSQQLTLSSKHKPSNLLLRIYGPQVEHLIDREAELGILRRLARKRIGPRLLGTFENGRFEEFLHATTLTEKDLRVPETSKQIAKRMRELHEGIDLLESELEAGPAVFINWDKWVDRVQRVACFLDEQVRLVAEKSSSADSVGGAANIKSKINPNYTRRGLICGVEWPVFRRVYEAYRARLVKDSGGPKAIRSNLVFAHNDTQYGNLMRLQPSGTSPLLQPSNHHKQLIVIDFEYASQNTAGLEFANHFTEWCYNYHHPERSTMCDTRRYPNQEEQYRFVRSYVMHRPQFNPSASATPKMEPREKTNINDFMLDARAPPGSTPASASASTGDLLGSAAMDYDVEERAREKAQEEEIQRLLRETRLWRLANSAMWVAWGIVQAKVPELDEKEESKTQRAKSIVEGVVDKVKGLTMGGGSKDTAEAGDDKVEHHAAAVTAQSDPLTDEDKRLQEQSKNDRPEGRAQEESHRQGGGRRDDAHAREAQPEEETTTSTSTDTPTTDEPEEETEEYDYLAYAHDRALFFWGDCVQMGIVKEEDLPESLRRSIKVVPF